MSIMKCDSCDNLIDTDYCPMMSDPRIGHDNCVLCECCVDRLMVEVNADTPEEMVEIYTKRGIASYGKLQHNRNIYR